MTDPLKEKLAALEHERWAHWQKWMHGVCTRNEDGSLTIPAVLVERWERQIATLYEDLSEREKDSDREQVNCYWHLIRSARTDGDARHHLDAMRAEDERLGLPFTKSSGEPDD